MYLQNQHKNSAFLDAHIYTFLTLCPMRKSQLKLLKKEPLLFSFKSVFLPLMHTAMNKHTAHFYMFED